ncbi:MAG: cache domain-containing protein [Candidatus Riflebacteria bacterium]|nr:cache domain-containing protein [Candidatus Riflebacteria bacterium]
MNLKSKIRYLIGVLLIVCALVQISITIQAYSECSEARLEKFRRILSNKRQKNLKDFVSLAYNTVQHLFASFLEKATMEKACENSLKGTIDTLFHFLNKRYEQVKAGELKLEAAKQDCLDEIKSLFFPEKDLYVWVQEGNASEPQMVMHPTIPELNGKTLLNPALNTAFNRGENIFSSCARIAKEQPEGGFVDYLFPKKSQSSLSSQSSALLPKLSYVRLNKNWNWVLGTGIFLDTAITDTFDSIKAELQAFSDSEESDPFWICDLEGKVIFQNEKAKKIAGSSLATTSNYISKSIETAKTNNGLGFFEDSQLFGFVMLYKPLRLIIGAGINLQEISSTIDVKMDHFWQTTALIIITSIIMFLFLGYFAFQILENLLNPEEIETLPSDSQKDESPIVREKNSALVASLKEILELSFAEKIETEIIHSAKEITSPENDMKSLKSLLKSIKEIKTNGAKGQIKIDKLVEKLEEKLQSNSPQKGEKE